MAKNLQVTLTFEYNGVLKGTDSSPIEGVRTAAIADPISVLLYPGRWFPLSGYLTDRFTRRDAHHRTHGRDRHRQRQPSARRSSSSAAVRNSTSIGRSPDSPEPSSPASLPRRSRP